MKTVKLFRAFEIKTRCEIVSKSIEIKQQTTPSIRPGSMNGYYARKDKTL